MRVQHKLEKQFLQIEKRVEHGMSSILWPICFCISKKRKYFFVEIKNDCLIFGILFIFTLFHFATFFQKRPCHDLEE